MKNVALFGPMYAGKSTIADALAEAGYHRMSFAAPIKNIAALAYGKIEKTGEYTVFTQGRSNPDWGGTVTTSSVKSGRQLLQEIGQYLKHVDRDFWLRCFFNDAKNYLDQPLTVDDGRFLFEYQALKDNGWMTVGIKTPVETRMDRAVLLSGRRPTEAEMNHESEVELPDILDRCDIVVDGTADAYMNARKILMYARGQHPEHKWYYNDLDGKPFPGICMLCGDLKEDAARDSG